MSQQNDAPESLELAALRQQVARLNRIVGNGGERFVAETGELYTGGLTQIVNQADFMPVGFGFDGPRQVVMNRATDRDDGANEPFVRNEQDLAVIRGFGRFISTLTNPGVGIIENLKNYTVGTGITASATPIKTEQPPAGLVKAVNKIVDKCLADNKIPGDLDREVEACSRIDGEWFLHVAPNPDARERSVIRQIEPACVSDPGHDVFTNEELRHYGINCRFATIQKWGVHADEHDVQNVHGYLADYNGDRIFSYLPKRYVHHLKRNVTRNVARGISDFYPGWKFIRQQERLLVNTGEGAAELAAIAYIIQYATATGEQVRTMRQGTASHQVQRQTPFGMQTVYKTSHLPGTALNVGQGQQYLPGPMGAERGQAFLDVVQAILRQVGVRWCMPEGMVSGDDSNNNLASSIEAGSRFHKFAEAEQGKTASAWVEILWIAVQNAYDAGYFREYGLTFEQIKECVRIVVTMPDVAVQKALEAAQVREIEKRNGILSGETWCEETGRDFETERDRGARDTSAATGGGDPFGGGFGGDPSADPQASSAGGEYASIDRRQFTRNVKAIEDILGKVAAGTYAAPTAKVMLMTVGLSQEKADQLLASVADGNLSESDRQQIAEDAAPFATPFARWAIEE